MTRVLFRGVCLIAFQMAVSTGGAFAQTMASAADVPLNDKPVAIDKTSTAPGDIPEIIRSPFGDDATPQPNAVVDPGAVLTPPHVNLSFLRSVRLDWDQLGQPRKVTSK